MAGEAVAVAVVEGTVVDDELQGGGFGGVSKGLLETGKALVFGAGGPVVRSSRAWG